jgi:hypothetical protein
MDPIIQKYKEILEKHYGDRPLRSLAGHDLESGVPGPGCGIVVVFVALGNGEQPLPDQGQEVVFSS